MAIPTTTKAIIHPAPSTAPELTTLTLSPLQPDEALVEVHAAGICHTDLLIANGGIPGKFPCVLGHEGSGKIIALGSALAANTCSTLSSESLAVGDSVLLTFASCSKCHSCSTQEPAYCESFVPLNLQQQRTTPSYTLTGSSAACHGAWFGQSSFAAHAVVHSRSLVKLATPLTPTELALFAPLGCGVQTGAGTVLNTLDPPSDPHAGRGNSIAVFGVGGVGMAAVMAARLRGCHPLIAVDVLDERLEMARAFGATHALRGDKPAADLVEEIKAICEAHRVAAGAPPSGNPLARGPMYALDCSGAGGVVEVMLAALGMKGRAASVGAPKPGTTAAVDVFEFLTMAKTYVGAVEGDSFPPKFLPYLIEQYREGRFPLERLVSFYKLEDFARAFEDTRTGKAIKPVILFGEV